MESIHILTPSATVNSGAYVSFYEPTCHTLRFFFVVTFLLVVFLCRYCFLLCAEGAAHHGLHLIPSRARAKLTSSGGGGSACTPGQWEFARAPVLDQGGAPARSAGGSGPATVVQLASPVAQTRGGDPELAQPAVQANGGAPLSLIGRGEAHNDALARLLDRPMAQACRGARSSRHPPGPFPSRAPFAYASELEMHRHSLAPVPARPRSLACEMETATRNMAKKRLKPAGWGNGRRQSRGDRRKSRGRRAGWV